MAIDFPDSPSNNDIYTVNGKRWIYSSGKWSIYGSTAPDATASDTEPTGVGDGHIWYRSDQSQTLIRYDNTWVEVGSAGGFDNASTSFPTSLDSATGFAAVEALQAKVGVDSSAVTSSHDYKIADHASRITTLETLTGYAAQSYTPTLTNWTATAVTGRYIQIGKLVYVFFEASGTITCSGIMRLTVPLAAASSNRLNGHHGIMLEGGVAWYPCMTTAFSTTQFDIYAMTQSGSSVRWLNTSATTPFTWGTGDAVSITFTYEAA